MIRTLFIVMATLAALGAVSLGYVVATGLSARAKPGSIETRLARAVRGLAVPREIRTKANPIAPGAKAVAAGMKIYAGYCASCHANDGSGDIGLGKSMFPPAPDMRQPTTQQLTDGEIFYIIEEGVRFTGMPGWSNDTPDGEEMAWNLVHFIRHLPKLTEAEKHDMESLNPQRP